jgi:hypothetical protein
LFQFIRRQDALCNKGSVFPKLAFEQNIECLNKISTRKLKSAEVAARP